MTTSLAAQLQKLALPQTQLLLRDKKRASLLFDPKEAAGIDRDTFYDIGISGLKELQKYNPEFATFENSLFSNTSKQIERAIQDREINTKLDKNIRKFLLLLSPYFLLKPAHKALEWLINRFSIHEYNKEDVLKLILPYHETNIFIRFLQILNFRNENDRWHWLRPLQKSGVHLTKTVLFNRAASEVSFLQFISDMTVQAVKENGSKANALTTMFTFYCTCTIGAFEHSSEITEPQISAILLSLLKGYSSHVPDFTASAYMITAQLLKKCKLNQKILNQLTAKITNKNQNNLRNEAALLLVLMFQSHEDRITISEKTLNNLVENDWICPNLGKLSKCGTRVTPLIIPLFKTLLEHITKGGCKNLMDALLTEVGLDDDDAYVVIRSVLENCPEVSSTDPKTVQWCSDLLKRFEHQYPNAFDKVIDRVMSSKNTEDKHRQALSSYLNFVMLTSEKKGNVDVFEKFYHPNPEFRIRAVNFLVKNFPTLNEKERDIFKGGITERLSDDDKRVVEACLNLKRKYLVQLLGKGEIVDVLIRLLRHCRKNSWFDVSVTVINMLCNVKVDQKTRIFLSVLPFMLPTNEKELTVALQVLKTEYVNESPVLLHVKNKVQTNMEPSSFCSVMYGAMRKPNLLPEPGLLIEELKMIRDDDAIHKYVSMILISCSLPKNVDPDMGSKVLEMIVSSIDSVSVNPAKKDEAIPIASRYISVARNGTLPLQGVLACLNTTIEKTRVDLNGKWIDLIQPNDSAVFLIRTVIFLLNGCSTNKTAQYYGKSMKVFFDKYFNDLRSKIEFVCNVSVMDEFQKLRMDSVSQLRGLKILNALVSKSDETVKHCLEFDSTVFVPCLLIAMSSPVEEIRRVAIDITSRIVDLIELKTETYKQFLREVYEKKEEILLDNEQLSLILFSVFERGRNENALRALLDVASDRDVPVHVTAQLLRILRFVDSSTVLSTGAKLGIHVIKSVDGSETSVDVYRSGIFYHLTLRLNETVAKDIKSDSPIWEMISIGMKSDGVVLEYEKNKFSSPAVLVMEQIDRQVFSSFDMDVQKLLIRLLAEVVTEADNPEAVSAVGRVVKKIDLDAKLIVDGLIEMRDSKSQKVDNNQRRSRNKITVPTVDILETKEWLRGVAMLEFVQDKKKIKNTSVLLPILFGVLKKCLDFDEQAPVEYPKQLLLSAILLCCAKMEVDREKVSEGVFNMELVVQCVRASQNPQTHHHALLVLARTASLIPDQVLHNVMAIFTFMGSSVLRHDDAYSFQIISKLVETIVPILVRLKRSEADDETDRNVSGVLRVFVDAMVDVPEHRRMPLYTKLLNTLDIERYLWLFLSIVFESHVVHGKEKPQRNSSVPQRLNIATDIVLEYPPSVIITTAIKVLDFLKELPEENTTADTTSTVLDVKKYTPKQFRHYKYTLVTFLSSVLTSKRFVNRIAMMKNDEMMKMEALYKNMIVNVLTYIQTVSKISDRAAGTPQAQYWKVMLHHSYDILDSINALLTAEMFLLVVRGLVVHNIPTVRRKALELLNGKLQHQPSFFYPDETQTVRNDLFALVPSLVDIIKTIDAKDVDSEQELLQQTALLTLKLSIKLSAENDPERFVPLLDFTTDLIKSNRAHGNVLASVVLCLAELVSSLRAYAIPSLTRFMPALIKVLKVQKQQTVPNLLLVCTVTAVQKIVESLPLFLSPYLDKLLFEICGMSSKWEDEKDDVKVGSFVSKLKTIRGNIGLVVPSRVLIPIVGRTYETMLESKLYGTIGALMNVLSENLSNVKPQELSGLLPELTGFFLKALEFRNDADGSDGVEGVEDEVIECLTVLVLKLSETSFRPLYYKLYDWAVRSDERKLRIVTFYRASHGIAESLKGLFVLFAGHFIKNAAQILDDFNLCKSERLCFDESKSVLLIESVLKTLRSVFSYDSQSFIDKDRFETLMQPLVDQLENRLGGCESLVKRSQELIIPCISRFAVSTADDSLWKRLNYQVLLKTRHDSPTIRSIGLDCVLGIANKIGQDFLPLLPETIPFLAELLEDEDENVETACRKAVQEMEKILGEPLQKYF